MHQVIWLSLAGLLVGFSQVINKYISKSKHSPITLTTALMWLAAIFTLPFLFINSELPKSYNIWLLILVSACLFAFSFMLAIMAYKKADISTVSIIQKTSIILIVLIGIIFLKEKYTLFSLIGSGLILLAGFVVVIEQKKIIISEGIFWALLSTILGVGATILDKIILKSISPFVYASLNCFLVGLVFAPRKGFISEITQLIQTHFTWIMLSALLNSAGFVMILFVLKNTDVSQTIPVYDCIAFIIPILLGIAILKEHTNIKKKIIGTTLGIVGILLQYI
ncbi:hypothetical protein COX08_04830 [Candidatus Beckwithbacteria bacterium CG23_combo_of_CG06-09_8_20_14_all_34_8]|uniref:EamA domain-containing protein n=1 Tax=Candidatus Beckwithbacteria bacterium CG23_combo_of_CG06-09_8_20_14_all_34_8 TaxID=1974497 RepID=A0A2H0B526_9BACT|nr:MAG: hypothetical protein COX08_04830 [Candidatus Beckwithbacteria bacterium CG23_combo_of_CG06-09_8_20_14_all_34_8]